VDLTTQVDKVVDLTLSPANQVSNPLSSSQPSQLDLFEVASSLSDEYGIPESSDSDYMTWYESSHSQKSLKSKLNQFQPLSGGPGIQTGSDAAIGGTSPPHNWRSSRASSSGGSEAFTSPSPQIREYSRDSSCSRDDLQSVSPSSVEKIPPPPFRTPPKLRPIERVMRDNPGKDVAKLRILTTALAREAIFGREELAQKSLSGRKNTGILDKEKLEYIKTLVHSRVPEKSKLEFESIWTMCRSSLSKSCQTLRDKKRRF